MCVIFNYDHLVMFCQPVERMHTFAMCSEPPVSDSSEPPLRGRRERKALATRRALLNAALGAFEHRSPAVVSVFDITEAADVAKGVFYLHFSSKEEFLLALLEDVRARFINEAATVHLARTLRSRAERLITRYHDFAQHRFRDARLLIRLETSLGDDAPLNGRRAAADARHFERLAALLTGRDGEARQSDDDAPPGGEVVELARTIDALCWSLIALAWRQNGSLPDPEIMRRTVLGAVNWRLSPRRG